MSRALVLLNATSVYRQSGCGSRDSPDDKGKRRYSHDRRTDGAQRQPGNSHPSGINCPSVTAIAWR